MNGFDLTILSGFDVILRTFLAALFGLLIGLDRGIKNKPVDFRVFIIVCTSTCLIAILSQELYADYAKAGGIVRMDLGNIIAGVLTGIGFLGSGAIIKGKDHQVIGAATGASIWASGGTGLALGFGFYGLALMMFMIIVLILVAGGYLLPLIHGHKDDGRENSGKD